MDLRIYFYSWLGPISFFSSLIIQCLSRSQFKWDLDGLFLVVFLSLFLPSVDKWMKTLSWLAIYGMLFCYNHFDEPLYFLAQSLSVIVTLKGLKFFKNEAQKSAKNNNLVLFYEKRLLDLLDEKVAIEKKLDTLVFEPLENSNCETQLTDHSDFQDYDESLDELEAKIRREIASFKEEKKPLKRLRKIAMKQTSFFDDQTL